MTQGWADAFEKEILELFCEVDTELSDVTFAWYRNKEQLQENTDMILYVDESYLNITSVEQAHQGGYTCQIHLENRSAKSEFSNTVDVTVYGEKSVFIKETSREEVVLFDLIFQSFPV